MHKTGLNAKPDCGLHEFTLQSLQYITSIIEAGGDSSEAQEPTMKAWRNRGIWADWWTGYETETEWERGYDMMLWFSRWVMPEQKSGIWRKEVNSWLISRSDKQLALPRSGGWRLRASDRCPLSPQRPRTLTSPHARIWLCPQQIHPEPHTRYITLAVFGHFFLAKKSMPSRQKTANRGVSGKPPVWVALLLN